MLILEACKSIGLSYMSSGKPIYRKVFYSPYPNGHKNYEHDSVIPPDNINEIADFIATIQLSDLSINWHPDTDKVITLWADSFEKSYKLGYDNLMPLKGREYGRYGHKHAYILENVKPLVELRDNVTDSHNVYADDDTFVNKALQLSKNINEHLGISINPVYIQYSIAYYKIHRTPLMQKLLSSYNAEPISYNDINGIRESLLSGGNPFCGDGSGALSRIRRIANWNCTFK